MPLLIVAVLSFARQGLARHLIKTCFLVTTGTQYFKKFS